MAGNLALIIDRGDMPSLAALGLERDRTAVLLWHLREPDAASERRLQVCRGHAAICGAQHLLIARPPDLGVPDLAPPPDLHRTQLLVMASAAAVELGCGRIVWPIQLATPDEMLREAERAQSVAALANLAGTTKRIDIELPVFDLADHQIVDLADDSGLPPDAFWPCARAEGPCGTCRGCRRWESAYSRAEVNWPWAVEAAAADC